MTVGNFSSVENTLQNIVGRVIHKDDVVLNRTATFKEIGADSLDVTQILVALEEALDIELVDEELKNIANMGGLIDYLQLKVNARK